MLLRPTTGQTIRHALAVVLLLPFVLASMVAAGTMPVRGDRGVEIVICIGSDLATITVPAGDTPRGDAPGDHDPCAWDYSNHPALAADTPATLTGPPLVLHPAQAAALVRLADRPAPLRRTANRGPPPAR